MPGTILIVEDHDAVRTAQCAGLQTECSQPRIIQAASGEAAVELARDQLPDVIIMDIALPGMSGSEATRRIKASTPGVYIMILTIPEEEAYRADAMAAGASAFVPKRDE